MSYTVANDKAKLDAALTAGDQLVVIDFSATWCGPCKDCEPIFQRLAEQYCSEVTFLKVDVDENEDAAMDYDVANLPTFLFLRKGEILDRLTGFTTHERLREAIEAHK